MASGICDEAICDTLQKGKIDLQWNKCSPAHPACQSSWWLLESNSCLWVDHKVKFKAGYLLLPWYSWCTHSSLSDYASIHWRKENHFIAKASGKKHQQNNSPEHWRWRESPCGVTVRACGRVLCAGVSSPCEYALRGLPKVSHLYNASECLPHRPVRAHETFENIVLDHMLRTIFVFLKR